MVTMTATVTAVVTFVATQTAGWIFGRLADGLATAATPALYVESSGPIASPWDVTIPLEPREVEGSLVRGEMVTRWAVNSGGGPSNRVRVELRISGNRDHAIVLDGVRATDVECREAPAWTEIRASVAGEIPMRSVGISLDSGNYDAVPQVDYSGETFRFPLQVSRTSLEFITVEVESMNSDCTFRLEIGHHDREAVMTHVVDDGGAPFRVVSPKAATARMEWRSSDNGFWSPVAVER